MSNNINTKATTFWDFLKDNTIEIPIIQRDYAQGRLGKENLRKNFLTDLKKALNNESPYKNTAMKLDFVYGSTENNKLNPLDGQQRLTTLWLLHWYIALRAGEFSEDNCTVFRKFTYETRISSREFCQNLCIPENFENFDGSDIVGFITKQTWFYSAWKQDPTIQSMLRMLGGTKVADKKGVDIVDGIEELFEETDTDFFDKYWVKLTADNAPIVFYHLPLKDFGLSDDLYIKMNARGKQLTSFENFKADLIGYITKQSENESLDENKQAEWKKLLDPESGIPIKLDTDWTDIFWKNKSNDNIIDEIYFAFMNRFFWNELFIAEDETTRKYILDIGKGDENSTQENNNSSYKYLNNSDYPNDYDTTIAYEGLEFYRYYKGTIPLVFFQKLAKVLDGYLKYSENNTLPNCSWDTTFRFIPQYVEEFFNNIEIVNNANEKILKVTTLNQVQRVVFFAVSKYFSDSETDQNNEMSLKQWMRVVWNLVSGEDHNGRPQIRSTQAMRTAMKFIGELNSHDVYSSLSNYELLNLGYSDFDNRCKEEIAKAKQILDENGDLRKYNGSCKKEDGADYKTWEDIIIRAESHAFFKGAIRFLFTNGEGNINWYDFDTKWENVRKYFNQNGINDDNKVLLTKLLVIQCTNWGEQLYDKQIFKPNANTWRWILTADNWTVPIHNILMDSNIIATKENDNKEVEKYVTPILNELPFDYLINNEPEGRFRWLGERLCFYKPYGRNMATLDWENWCRNAILSDLLKLSVISTDAQMGNSNFFWGWNINFSYKNHHFQWYGQPNEKKLDVYLMEEDWINCKVRCCPTNHKGTDEDTYFCFRVDMSTTPNTFTNKLNDLISQAAADKQAL